MKVTESIENYLERILMLSKKTPMVRAIDIANDMNVTKPSVSHATKLMREQGHINVAPDGAITLTDAGAEIARAVLNRHMVLAKFFMSLGVSEATAFQDACLVEHDISEETFSAICRRIESL